MKEDLKRLRQRPGRPVDHDPVILIETGEVFETFTEAAKAIDGDRSGVRRVAQGTQSHHKSYHFIFKPK